MEEFYIGFRIFKALGDPKRAMIVDMLSCGELCACKILEKFDMSQSTLSHHMKILCECGLVVGRNEEMDILFSQCRWHCQNKEIPRLYYFTRKTVFVKRNPGRCC